MIKHIWSVLCQKSIVDQHSNNISLLDVFEELKVNTQPSPDNILSKFGEIVVPVTYQIVSLWTHDPIKKELIDLRVDFNKPDGSIKTIFENELELPSDKIRIRNIININGIGIKNTGKYIFEIKEKSKKESKFKTVAELPLEIFIDKNLS